MNKHLFFLIAFLTVLSGCSHNYTVTLSNGARVGASSKPKLEGGYYHFKDINGRETVVPEVRVREIAPASMVEEEDKNRWQTQTKKKK